MAISIGKLESGFYWTRSEHPNYPSPTIAEWNGRLWYLCGVSATFERHDVVVLSSRLSLSSGERSANDLSPAEVERLALLVEEGGEVLQAIGKVLRHGYESFHPDGGPSNRSGLQRELGDMLWVLQTMCGAHDISEKQINLGAVGKHDRVRPWLHHQD